MANAATKQGRLANTVTRLVQVPIAPIYNRVLERPEGIPGKVFRKLLAKTPETVRNSYPTTSFEYRMASAELFQISDDDLKASRRVTSTQTKGDVRTATWFIPDFHHFYAGIVTILRTAAYFAEHGVKITFVVHAPTSIPNTASFLERAAEHFPALKGSSIYGAADNEVDLSAVPETDIAFGTHFTSAYYLLKFNKTRAKFYFVQDYEPSFYAAGSMYGLAESTYRFGFTGIFNTPGLAETVMGPYGMKGISFVPAVDQSVYYPPAKRDTDRPTRIFLYARPGSPRNAFELGVLTISELQKKYGDKIEIVTAGAEWDEASYGLAGRITNVGLLKSLTEVADLYRSCDIGFVFMFSKHPSYQPLEYMACGVATVTNRNEANAWLLKHERNCLLAEPSPLTMAAAIGRLVDDPELRSKIAAHGHETVQGDWDVPMKSIWEFVQNPVV